MDSKTIVFNDFARKAKERIEARKKLNTRQFLVADAGVTVTLQGLTEQEIQECTERFESSLENDKYTLYMACPELQEASKVMTEDGSLKESERYKITEMFSLADRNALVKAVLDLSGFNQKSSVKPVDEVQETKN
jgi:hypothetical protein